MGAGEMHSIFCELLILNWASECHINIKELRVYRIYSKNTHLVLNINQLVLRDYIVDYKHDIFG